MGYAELLCCSNFTFQRGASHARELVQRANELGYRAIAITDECTLAGIVRAHESATEVDIPLLIGSHFRFAEGDRVVLLTPNHGTYSQLCELITRAHRQTVKGQYQLTRADFEEALSEAIGIWIPGARIDPEHARWFGSLKLAARYIGFTHTLAQDSDRRLDQVRALAEEFQIPVTALSDVYYHIRDRRRLHAAGCISDKNVRYSCNEGE